MTSRHGCADSCYSRGVIGSRGREARDSFARWQSMYSRISISSSFLAWVCLRDVFGLPVLVDRSEHVFRNHRALSHSWAACPFDVYESQSGKWRQDRCDLREKGVPGTHLRKLMGDAAVRQRMDAAQPTPKLNYGPVMREISLACPSTSKHKPQAMPVCSKASSIRHLACDRALK